MVQNEINADVVEEMGDPNKVRGAVGPEPPLPP